MDLTSRVQGGAAGAAITNVYYPHIRLHSSVRPSVSQPTPYLLTTSGAHWVENSKNVQKLEVFVQLKKK